MHPSAQFILEQLQRVETQRRVRAQDAGLAKRVEAIKAYQQRRFASTYSDLLASARYGPAANFFLDDLYGPRDFSVRDAQLARVIPSLVRLFPEQIVDVVRDLAVLHAMSEELDTEMARQMPSLALDEAGYGRAWRATGQPDLRSRQIALTIGIGSWLDKLTRKHWLRRALHLMREPARAVGLTETQRFLESGFDAFVAMNGAQEFLRLVETRERAFADALFAGPGAPRSGTDAT